MPIFEDELSVSIPDNKTIPNPDLRSIDEAPIATPTGPFEPLDYTGNRIPRTITELAKYRNEAFTGFEQPYGSASAAETEENLKYPAYRRGDNLENIYGLGQSAWSQWGNSIVKFAGNTVGIFAQSFAAIPNIIDAGRKGDFSQLSGDEDGFEGTIDNWLENLENTFPNYYTDRELDNPWTAVIPFAPGSANFWGDKFLKNLGFTVGAIGGVLVQDAIITSITGGVGTAPLIAGQVGSLALKLNKVASVFKKGQIAANLAKTAGASKKTYGAIKALETMSSMAKLKNGAQFTTTMLGASITEAGVESREGYRQIKEELTRDYYLTNGKTAKGADLEAIEKVSTDAMNIRFGINAAILMGSNTLLFGNLARAMKASGLPVKGALKLKKGPMANLKSFGLKEGSLDTFERKAVTGFANKAWERVRPVLPIMVSEGVYEEGGQFATEKGTYDYFTRKYKNLNNPNNRKAWDTLEESVKSTMHGLNEQFTTDEGWQNMFIGAMTGLFVTGIQGVVDKKRKTDTNSRTDKVINLLNEDYLTGIFKQKYEDTAQSIAIVEDMQEAAASGDTFRFQNLQHDAFFNFVNSRSKSGAHEVTIEQLELLKDLDKAEFETYFGVELSEENVGTVGQYVDQLIEEANQINKVVSKLDSTYKNPFKWVADPETEESVANNTNHLSFENWKKEVAYLNSKQLYVQNKKAEAFQNITEIAPALSGEMVADLMNRSALKDIASEYEQEASTLEQTIELTTSARERTKIRKNIKKLRTLGGQASLLANNLELSDSKQKDYFKALLQFENAGRQLDSETSLNDQDAKALLEEGVSIARANDLKDNLLANINMLTSESGFKKYLETEKDVQAQVVPEEKGQVNYVNEENENVPLELNREYELSDFTPLNYKNVGKDRWEVPKPDGTKVYTKTEPQAKAELKDTNDTLSGMNSVIVLAILPNGAVKVEDKSGNIYDIDPSRLKGYKKIKSVEEFVQENQEELEGAEEAGGLGSSTIPTVTSKETFGEEGGRRKDEQWLFTSTTTESDDIPDNETSAHIIRSRIFLNNVRFMDNRDDLRSILITGKHAKQLGLDGILEQSYKGNVPKNVYDENQGWMASVFVLEKEDEKGDLKRYFVDQDGQATTEVGQSANLDTVIYQTMSTTDLNYKKSGAGKGNPKYRQNQKTDAEYRQKQWVAYRELYFSEENTEPLVFPFRVSRGLPNVINGDARNAVVHLVPESEIATNETLLQIPNTGIFSFQGQRLAVAPGVPIIVYRDVAEYVQNRKFSKDEATTLYEVMKVVVDNVNGALKNHKKPSLLGEHWNYVQQVIYTKSKGATAANQIRVNILQRRVQIGGINFSFDTFEESKDRIIAEFEDTYSSVNNQTLTKEFGEEFTEFILDEKGNLAKKEWENYQTYLLSPKDADGKSVRKGGIPLTTNIAVPSTGVPYTHKQKYAILKDVDLPVIEKIKPPQTPGVKNKLIKDAKADKVYNLNQTHVNTYTFGTGDVSFIGDITKDTIDITIIEDEVTLKTIETINKKESGIQAIYTIHEKLFGEQPTILEKEAKTNDLIIKVQEELIKIDIVGLLGLDEIVEEEVEVEDGPISYVLDGETENTFKLKDGNGITFKASKEAKGKIVIDIIPSVATGKAIKALEENETVQNTKDALVKAGLLAEDSTPGDVALATALMNVEMAVKASLEPTTKPDDTSQEKKGRGGTTQKGKRNFRLIGKNDHSVMTPEDLIIFKKWHSENLPNIPFEVLVNMITVNPTLMAWGVFEKGIAKFVEGGLRGTEYHEIFEGVWHGMLNKEEHTELLNEFRDSKGQFTDRASGKTYLKSDPTVSDEMIKERIADDFADWRLKKITPKTFGQKALAFFQRVLQWLRITKKKTSLKEDLFEALDSGKFKERTLDASVNQLPPQYRAVEWENKDGEIERMPETLANEYVEDMIGLAAGILFDEKNKKALFQYQPISKNVLFNTILEKYFLDDYPEVVWQQLIQRAVEKLRPIGINFNENDEVSINEEGSNSKEYTEDTFTVDSKSSSPQGLKFLLATLFETKQDKSANLTFETSEYVETSIEGYKLLNYGKVFGVLIDKLSNTNNIDLFIEKLGELADVDNNYIRLYERLGGTFQRKNNRNKSFVDFTEFKRYDWRLFIQFYQAFSKQFPEAYVQYNNNGDVYTASINKMSTGQDVRKAWIDNMKLLAKDKDSFVYYDKIRRIYKIKPIHATIEEYAKGGWLVTDPKGNKKVLATEKLAKDHAKKVGISIRTDSKSLDFINSLGIEFTEADLKKLDRDEKTKFNVAVGTLYTYLGKNNELVSLTGKTLAVNKPFLDLANLYINANGLSKDSTHFGIDQKRRNNYALDNAPSILENDFKETKGIGELKVLRPELNDVYSRNSLILTKGTKYSNKNGTWKKRLKVTYIQGTKDISENTATTTTSLVLSNRHIQEINQNINGDFYIIIPADSSTEWMLNIGNNFSFKEMSKQSKWDKVIPVFIGYLKDEINLARDYGNRDYLRNIKGRSQELRMFRDILSPSLVKEIEALIKDEKITIEDINAFITANMTSIENSIIDTIRLENDTLKATLLDNNKVIRTSEDTFSFEELDSNFAIKENLNKDSLSGKELNDILDFLTVNYAVANIEMHKILFGDPYLFATKAGVSEAMKRIKSFLSPAKKMFDHPAYNSFLNRTQNIVGNDIQLTEKDHGYQKHKDHAKTVVLTDHKIAGSLSNTLFNYANTDVTDGFSWIMPGTFREVMDKNGQWSDQAEEFYQYEMAYTRQNIPGYKYTNPKLAAHDKKLMKSDRPEYYLKILKPIVRGTKNRRNHIDLALDKFAQMPVFFSMVENTTMEKFYIQMFNEKVDYALVESARKVGIETSHDLYNGDGTFNDKVFNNSTDIPWKYYGIQVETAHDGVKYQTRGSQITKIVTINLFANGKPIGATPERQRHIQKLYDEYLESLDEMHQNAYNSLLSRLGIIDLGDGNFGLEENSKKISDALVFEMLRRDVSENVKDTVKLDKNDQFIIPFEASPSYVQIKDIMYSMINKSLLSPKMTGGAHVQVSSAMFEKATEGAGLAMKTEDGWAKITRKYYDTLTPEQKGKVVLTNNTLKFYENEDGKRHMEIMLPHWFKKQFKGMFESDKALLEHLNSSDELKQALMGIGFRIPTQASSSIEVFKVAGFLPQYMGATVVVPAEITTKSGSDFDIDKLNIYLKSLYLDENGKIRYVKVLGNEENTKKHFSDLFDKKLNIDKDKVSSHIKNVREALAETMLNADSKLSGDEENIKTLLGEIFDEFELKNSALYNKFDKLNDAQIQEVLKQRYVENMYKKALENKHYEALEALITLEENFDSLISPVDDGGYKATAERIRQLRGVKTPKNTLISRNYLTNKRNSFALAKKWIGIAAVNITGLSNRQKTTVIFDRTRIEHLSDYYRKWIGDGTIQLPHNTVEIDGVSYLSLSGLTTAEKQRNPFLNFLSNRLSGFATSTVDVAADDYILDVYSSDLLISTAMFLEAMGAGETGRMFIAQPIIQRFVQKLDNANDNRIFNQRNIDEVLDEFPVKSTFDPTDNTIDLSTNTTGDFKGFTKLEENISVYANTKDHSNPKMIEYNEQQAHILGEFLKYTKLGKDMFMLNQATNYDTSKIRNGEEYIRKEIMTQLTEDESLLTSADDILNSTFIGKQKELMNRAINMLSAVFKLDQPKFKAITNKVLQKYAERAFISNKDFSEIIQNIKVSYLDYLIETHLNLSEEIQELLLDEENSIALRIKQASLKYNNLNILKDLEIHLSQREGGAQTIKLDVNNTDAYDDNHYIGLMREFRDFNEETNQLYQDLIKVSILQGSKRSRISIKNIIPLEDYAKIVTPIVEQAQPNYATDVFAKGMFERNNFNSPVIMPKFYPKFVNVGQKDAKQHVTIDRDTGEDIYLYKPAGGKNPIFPFIQSLGLKSNDKRLMVLNERYNFKIIDNEFLKIPRTIQVENEYLGGQREYVDLTNNRSITYSKYRQALKKGDTSLYDFFGYQKVKLPDGNYLTVTNEHGETQHIYKQINLLGDSNMLTEYYPHFRPSAVDNGSVKVRGEELSDADIIAYYDGKSPNIAPVKEQYSFLAMKEDNVAMIKAGTKTITNRKTFIDNGTYKVKGGNFVSLKLIGQGKVVNIMAGKKVVQFTNGKKMSLDEFATKEGFKDWADFSENSAFSENFINRGQSRYVYDVMPVVLSEEERIAAKEVWKNVKPASVQTKLFESSEKISVEETPIGEVGNPAEYTLHSGGAYGADTFWDIIGREFGLVSSKHYRDKNNQNLSKQLKAKGIKATVLTKEQMDLARAEIESILGIKYKDDLRGNLQVRNYYQVKNSDSVFAIAKGMANESGKAEAETQNKGVTGGTNTAVQLAIRLDKPVYVFSMGSYTWYKWNGQFFEKIEYTPTLTKNFAGIGTRELENYNIKNKETGKWELRDPNFSDFRADKTKEAIRDVYKKTFKPGPFDNIIIPKHRNVNDKVWPLGDYTIHRIEGQYDVLHKTEGVLGERFDSYEEAEVAMEQHKNENKKDDFLEAAEKIQKDIDSKQNLELVFADTKGLHLIGNLSEYLDYAQNVPEGHKFGSHEDVNMFEAYLVQEGILEGPKKDNSEFSYQGKTINTEFPLSPDQTLALQKMIDFVNSGDPRFTLQGAAGTGKTSLIGYLQKYINARKVLYMAPTHAATVELAFGTMKTGNRNLPITVASSMKFNMKTNKYVLSKKATERLGFGKLIVVDETSMLATKDYVKLKYLEELNLKIIFLGDKKQIPEVIPGSVQSKVISVAFTENPGVSLDVIHRTSNKDIKNVLQKVRDSIKFQLYNIKENTENLIFFNSDVNFKQALKEFVTKAPEDTDYIGYTNRSVSSMNKLIREEIFGREGEVQKDDIVMGYLGYSSKQVEEGNLANSVGYTVTDVEKFDHVSLSGYELTLSSKRLSELKKAGFSIPQNSRTQFVPLGTDESLQNKLSPEELSKNNSTIASRFENMYNALTNAKKEGAHPSAWAAYYRAQGELGSFFRKVDLGGDYIYDKVQNKMVMYEASRDFSKYKAMYGNDRTNFIVEKGIDFGHAITIHKSQGRTTKNVFFDANTITKYDTTILEEGKQISTERQSLGYVGLSRASENLFVNKGWVDFKDVDNTEAPKPEAPEAPEAQQTGPLAFKIDHYVLTLNPDGRVFFKNGTEVTDDVIINKVQIAKEHKQGTLRIGVWNESKYFVLSDDRILGAGKTNYAKETIADQELKDKVLAKAILYKKEC